MNGPPVVAPIVEGHGEVAAVRGLISRIGFELMNGTWIDVAQPFRLDSGKMRKPDELSKAIHFQSARILGRGGVLVLRDGDDSDADCAPGLAASLRPHPALFSVDVQVVIAWREYEAWFLAAVESLRSHAAVRDDATAPANPEAKRGAKHELEKLMLESYKETLHQAKFSSLMDLGVAQQNSRSFRRLTHAIECLVGAGSS